MTRARLRRAALATLSGTLLLASVSARAATVIDEGFETGSFAFVDSVVLDGASSATATEAVVRRRGTRSARIERVGGALRSYLGFDVTSAPFLAARAGVRIAGGTGGPAGLELMGIAGATPAVPLATVLLEPDGTLALLADDGTGALATVQPAPDEPFPDDTWVELELRYASGAGAELHRDGVRVATLAAAGAAGPALSVHLGQRAAFADLSQATGTLYLDILRADDAGPVGMARDRPALALVDRGQPGAYADYASERVRGSLDHLGLVYREVDLSSEAVDAALLEGIDLVVLAQEGLASTLALAEQDAIAAAVTAGAGLVSFDPFAADYASSALQAALGDPSYDATASTTSTLATAAPGTHFALADQPLAGAARSYAWPVATSFQRVTDPGAATVLATGSGFPQLLAHEAGSGRVLWWLISSELWDNQRLAPDAVSLEQLGHLHGLDDVLWRGIVWAHRKPMLWFPLPTKLTALKIDDVKGRALDGATPLDYADSAAQLLGAPVHLSVFLDDIDASASARAALASLEAAGRIEISAHAYTGGDIDPNEPASSFLYWDGEHDEPFSAGELDQRWADTDDFFAGTGRGAALARSAWLAPHQSVAGDGNAPRALARDVDLSNMIVDLATSAGTGMAPWTTPAPFGSGCHALAPLGQDTGIFNVSTYGDCLFWDFDFLVKRGVLAPVTTTTEAIQNALLQARRAHGARFPMLFVPHEYVLTGNPDQGFDGTGFDLADWSTVVTGLRDALALDDEVEWVAPEALGRRTRDHARTRILSLTRSGSSFQILLEGHLDEDSTIESWNESDQRGRVPAPAFDGTSLRSTAIGGGCGAVGDASGGGGALAAIVGLALARRRFPASVDTEPARPVS